MVFIGAVVFALAGTVAQAARQTGKAHSGDGGGVCTEGSQPGDVDLALHVKIFFCGAVDAHEGVVGFATGCVHGHDGIGELHQDTEPDGWRRLV